MLRSIVVLVVTLVAMPFPSTGQPAVRLTEDIAVLSQSTPGFRAEITLKSRLVPAADVFPESGVGQFLAQLRVVQWLKIVVNGRELFVPRSAYADLALVTSAEVTTSKSSGWLTVRGGDGSESYVVQIDFDNQGVRSRALFSSLIPNAPTQRAQYFTRSLR